MGIRFVPCDNKLYAFLQGEIDHHTAASMRRDLDAALAHFAPREFILDFSDVTFMDSSGVGLVMGRYRAAKAQQCSVRVVHLRERDRKIMQMSGLSKLVAFEEVYI